MEELLRQQYQREEKTRLKNKQAERLLHHGLESKKGIRALHEYRLQIVNKQQRELARELERIQADMSPRKHRVAASAPQEHAASKRSSPKQHRNSFASKLQQSMGSNPPSTYPSRKPSRIIYDDDYDDEFDDMPGSDDDDNAPIPDRDLLQAIMKGMMSDWEKKATRAVEIHRRKTRARLKESPPTPDLIGSTSMLPDGRQKSYKRNVYNSTTSKRLTNQNHDTSPTSRRVSKDFKHERPGYTKRSQSTENSSKQDSRRQSDYDNNSNNNNSFNKRHGKISGGFHNEIYSGTNDPHHDKIKPGDNVGAEHQEKRVPLSRTGQRNKNNNIISPTMKTRKAILSADTMHHGKRSGQDRSRSDINDSHSHSLLDHLLTIGDQVGSQTSSALTSSQNQNQIQTRRTMTDINNNKSNNKSNTNDLALPTLKEEERLCVGSLTTDNKSETFALELTTSNQALSTSLYSNCNRQSQTSVNESSKSPLNYMTGGQQSSIDQIDTSVRSGGDQADCPDDSGSLISYGSRNNYNNRTVTGQSSGPSTEDISLFSSRSDYYNSINKNSSTYPSDTPITARSTRSLPAITKTHFLTVAASPADSAREQYHRKTPEHHRTLPVVHPNLLRTHSTTPNNNVFSKNPKLHFHKGKNGKGSSSGGKRVTGRLIMKRRDNADMFGKPLRKSAPSGAGSQIRRKLSPLLNTIQSDSDYKTDFESENSTVSKTKEDSAKRYNRHHQLDDLNIHN